MYMQIFSLRFAAQMKEGCSILRAISTLSLKLTRTRKIWKLLWGKILHNYEGICNKTCLYEQKPVKIDGFNKAEEKEVKERVKKRKKEKKEVAENKNFFLKKKKQEDNKEKETEMWKRLGELN